MTILEALNALGFAPEKVVRGKYNNRVDAVYIKGVGKLYRTEIYDFARAQEEAQGVKVLKPMTRLQELRQYERAYKKALPKDVAKALASAKIAKKYSTYNTDKYGNVNYDLTKKTFGKRGAEAVIQHLDNIKRLYLGLAYDANVMLEADNIESRGSFRGIAELIEIAQRFRDAAGRMTEANLTKAIEWGYAFDNNELASDEYISRLSSIL